MKFYLISDNVDTEMGLRLVGIEGEVVHKRRDFLEVLETKMKDRSIGVILITTKLIELAPDVISEIKLKQQKPLLVEIPIDMEILKLVKRLIDMFQKQLELSYRRKCYAKKRSSLSLYQR